MSYSLLLTSQFFPSKRCPGLRRILLHRAILALALLHAVLIHLDLLTLTRHTQRPIGQTGMVMTGIELGLTMNETAWLMTIPAGAEVVALNLMKASYIFLRVLCASSHICRCLAGRKRRRSMSPYERDRYEPRPRYNDDYGLIYYIDSGLFPALTQLSRCAFSRIWLLVTAPWTWFFVSSKPARSSRSTYL